VLLHCLTKEAFGRNCIALFAQEEVYRSTLLVHCSIQVRPTALTLKVAVGPLRGLHQAAISKMSNSLFTKCTSSLPCGLHVRQCPRRIIRIISNPFIVAAAVFIV
jgi:hypothetical protein